MSLPIVNVLFVFEVIDQSSDASSDSSAIKNREADSPSAPVIETLSEDTATSPVPLGDKLISPLESVDDIVFPSALRLSTFKILS